MPAKKKANSPKDALYRALLQWGDTYTHITADTEQHVYEMNELEAESWYITLLMIRELPEANA